MNLTQRKGARQRSSNVLVRDATQNSLDCSEKLVHDIEPFISSCKQDLLNRVRSLGEGRVDGHGEDEDDQTCEGRGTEEGVEEGDADEDLERRTVDHVETGDRVPDPVGAAAEKQEVGRELC